MSTLRIIGSGGPARRRAAYGSAAPAGDIVILAVPCAVVLDVVQQYGESLAGQFLVDITNHPNSDFTDFATPWDRFGAQEIARVAPADVEIDFSLGVSLFG